MKEVILQFEHSFGDKKKLEKETIEEWIFNGLSKQRNKGVHVWRSNDHYNVPDEVYPWDEVNI